MERRDGPIRDESGQSLIELALALPLLVFGLIGGADLARAFAFQVAVQNGARAGAEAAAINSAPTSALAIGVARDEMARTPGMDASAATITAAFARTNGTACTTEPTAAEPCFITVRVRYSFETLTAWPIVPNRAELDRTTVMRTIAAGS